MRGHVKSVLWVGVLRSPGDDIGPYVIEPVIGLYSIISYVLIIFELFRYEKILKNLKFWSIF